jgi:hypothetical protein
MESPRISKVPPFSTSHITELLLVLGTALLIYWQPLSERIPLKASDGIFAIGICLWLPFLIREEGMKTLRGADVWFIPPLLASILVATLMGDARYHLGMSRDGILLLGRLLTCIALFLMTYSLLRRDPSLRRLLSLAFLFPLALFPAMAIPHVFATMWDSAGRFQGLTVNANTAAKSVLIALALAYTLGAYEAGMKRPLRALAFFSVTAAMLMVILWTQSRAYLIAAFVSALLGTVLVAKHHRVPTLKFAFVAVSGLALIVTGILLLEPRQFIVAYLTRVSPAYFRTPETPTSAPQTLPQSSGPPRTMKRVQRFLGGIIPRIEDDTRTPAMRYYSQLLSTNYFGLGLNFESKFTVYHPPTRTWQGPNTILDLPLYGGVGAVLSVAYLAFLVGRKTKERLTPTGDENVRYTIGAVIALGGLWSAAVLVGSPLFDYQFWILTAMALA